MTRTLLLSLFLLSLPMLYAQQPPSLEDRVAQLEQAHALEPFIEKKVDEAAQKQRSLLFLTGLGIFVAVVGGWRAVWLNARAYADKQVAEKLSDLLETRKETLLQWMRENEREQQLLDQSRMCVWSYQQEFRDQAPLAVSRALERFNTRNVVFQTLNQGERPALPTQPILFIHNANGKFPIDWANQCLKDIENQPHRAVFYFGSQHLDWGQLTITPYASTANLPAQVYGNLLNLLKIHSARP